MAENRCLRFRLFFDDRRLLKKAQRSEGLRRCWILLKPGLATVADLASHIGERFGIRDRIVLSIDDFVLPVFETTFIIKDTDIISIKKEKVEQTIICAPCDGQVQVSPTAKVHYFTFCNDAPNVGPSNFVSAKRNREYTSSLPNTKRTKKEGSSAIKPCCSTKCNFEGMLSSQSTSFTPVNDNSRNDFPNEASKTVDGDGLEAVPCRERGKVKEISGLQCQNNISCNNDVWENRLVCPNIHQSSDGEEDIVQVEVQPGHIRFVPREKSLVKMILDAGQTKHQSGQTKNSQFYSGTRTQNIQHYHEKIFSEINESENYHKPDEETIVNGKCSFKKPEVMSSNRVRLAKQLINFESLPSLCRLPREGDILAYRYVELSSSVFPELSAPQVGKVSSFDCKSLEIKLIPVPDYDFLLNDHLNGALSKEGVSIYKEDGSLEIDYPSLVDVRLLKARDSQEVDSQIEPARKDNWEPARKDNWEAALEKSNWNEPAASLQDSSIGWGQWIPSKSTHATFSSGLSNAWTNWTPSRNTTNWTPCRNATNWTPNRSKNNWNPKNNNSATTYWSSRASKTAAPWRSRQTKFIPHRGKYSGSGKY